MVKLMFDASLRRLVDPVLVVIARAAIARGATADGITGLAFVAGLGCAVAVAQDAFGLALALLLVSRAADGLDGIVAGLTRRTERGGFLDIVGDFVFYGAVPFAFALRAPQADALPAAFLLLCFYVNGATFLAYAAVAAARRMISTARGPKSIHFTAGLAEGGETIAAFAAMLAWPTWFGAIAYGFGVLCLLTAASRVLLAWRSFAP